MNKKWTEEEVEILKDNYATLSRNDLCRVLSDRTWCSIQYKASRLKLTLPTAKQRFWRQVDKKQCWNWIGYCNADGYGRFKINNKMIYTHRFSWEIHFGKIPDGMCVLHRCDIPSCVNPNHLFLGVRKDNSDDMVTKNRQAKGESQGHHKLNEDQVKEIRRLCRERNFLRKEIAKIFNVNPCTISTIYKNKTWRHIK